MNKCFVSIFLVFLSLIVSVSAVTINSVKVIEPDVFYSGVDGNNKVNLEVNITGANSSDSAIVVTADFFDFAANCQGPGTSEVITLNNFGGDIWKGTCIIGDKASALPPNSMTSGRVIIKANETYGQPSSNSDLNIAIYNIDVPAGNNCYRFVKDSSTDFNKETNFNNMYLKLTIQVNDGSDCISKGFNWNTGWLTVGELTFNGVNFNNDVNEALKIRQLADIVKLSFSSSKTFQNTKLLIDTKTMPALNVTPVTVKLSHLSLLTQRDDFVIADNGVVPQSIDWRPNGFDEVMQYNTFNLSFIIVQKGFKTFTISDNVIPTVISYTPTVNQVLENSTVRFNALLNGTGSEISKSLFIINGVSNTANCTSISSEIYNCSLQLNQNDGQYNLTIASYDFGGETGNLKQLNLSYIVQTSAPNIVIKHPSDSAKYTATAGSMLKLNFSATDGNGVSSCWYSLNDERTNINDCENGVAVQLYLKDDTYYLVVGANDSLGKYSTKNITFTVADTKAPIITNNTKLSNKNTTVLSVITDESAVCRYDTRDTAYEKMDDTFKNDVTMHNASITLAEKGKIYTYYVRCTDLSDNINKESVVINLYYGEVTQVEPSQVEDIPRDPFEKIELAALSAGRNVMVFSKTTNPLEAIALVTNYAVTDLDIIVTTVSKPSVTYLEKVYKYVTIDHTALSDSTVEAANITFRVDKKWLSDYNVSKNDIILVRYSKNWTVLDTSIVKEDSDNIYYTAVSPGLSLFAISIKKVEPKVASAPIRTNNSNVTLNSAASELLSKRPHNWFWIITIGIIVFVLIVLAILVKKYEINNPPIFPEDRTMFGRIRRLFR
jgi:PGF-pre-PGF domain-containing protein